MAATAQNNPNMPTTGVDGSKWQAQGQTAGPYGNDPATDARGEFGEPVRDLN